MALNLKESLKITRRMGKVLHKTSLGIYYFANGERIEGTWKNDLLEGQGKV